MNKHQIISIFKKNNKVLIFLGNLFLLFALYIVFYHFFRYKDFVHEFYEIATQTLTTIYLYISKGILYLFGFETIITGKHITIIDDNGIILNRGCLGRNLKMAYIGLVIAFPVSFKIKMKYLFIGLLCIFCANALRVTALTYIHAFHREYFQATHNLIFKIFVYSLTFLIWHLMFKEYSRKKKDGNIKHKHRPQ